MTKELIVSNKFPSVELNLTMMAYPGGIKIMSGELVILIATWEEIHEAEKYVQNTKYYVQL